jgi:hypothetical protein
VERRRGSLEEETRASAFVVPVRLRHVAVVHEQRKRCISDVAMMLTKKIIIIIIIIGRRGERGEGEGAFLESWEETEEEEESASSSSNHPQIKRRHSQREHPSYQKN